MSNKELIEKIDRWRDCSLHLRRLEKEITDAVKDGPQTVTDGSDGFVIEKTGTRVLITHFEGWTGSFIRPDIEVSVKAIPKSKLGRRRKFASDAERYAFHNKKRRAKKAEK
jgi:hypothetical protein